MEFFNSFFPTKTNNNNKTINLAQTNDVNTMPTPISQEDLINIQYISKNIADLCNKSYQEKISEYSAINPDIPFIKDIYDFPNKKFIEYTNFDQINSLITKMHTPTESNELTKVQIYYDLLTELEKNAYGIYNYFYYDEHDIQHLGGSYKEITNFEDCLPELIKYSIYLKKPNEINFIAEKINEYLTYIKTYIKTLQNYELKLNSELERLETEKDKINESFKKLSFFNINQKQGINSEIINLNTKIDEIKSIINTININTINNNTNCLNDFRSYEKEFIKLRAYVVEVQNFKNNQKNPTGGKKSSKKRTTKKRTTKKRTTKKRTTKRRV